MAVVEKQPTMSIKPPIVLWHQEEIPTAEQISPMPSLDDDSDLDLGNLTDDSIPELEPSEVEGDEPQRTITTNKKSAVSQTANTSTDETTSILTDDTFDYFENDTTQTDVATKSTHHTSETQTDQPLNIMQDEDILQTMPIRIQMGGMRTMVWGTNVDNPPPLFTPYTFHALHNKHIAEDDDEDDFISSPHNNYDQTTHSNSSPVSADVIELTHTMESMHDFF
jgi:hypothetical protein